MAFLEVRKMQVQEIVRRWQAGESHSTIARGSGVSRRTVRRYIVEAQALGATQTGASPDEELLGQLVQRNHPGPLPRGSAAGADVLEPNAEKIRAWLEDDELQLTRVHELLQEAGVVISYSTLRRYARQTGLRKGAQGTTRMADWPPGEAVEMDFGRLGRMVDQATSKKLTVWALILVLPMSRHGFVWPLLRQTLEESIAGLDAAWRFFGGVPKRLVLDNFPAAIAGPDNLNPKPTAGFLEYCQARGILADPARVRHPRDKPHVERQVPYVRERFFKGGTFRGLDDCREQAERWCLDVAGMRVHGTTRQLPRLVFEVQEQPRLQPYDGLLYDVPEWKEVTVHLDFHVSFGQALYSVPSSTCPPGTKLEARGDRQLLKLYLRGALIKAHVRQPRGGRATDADDYPKEKTAYALRSIDHLIASATALGANVETFACRLFDGPLPWAKFRAGLKLLSLGEKYGATRLDAACARSLAYDLVDVRRLQGILIQALDVQAALPLPETEPSPGRFARPGNAFSRGAEEATRGDLSLRPSLRDGRASVPGPQETTP